MTDPDAPTSVQPTTAPRPDLPLGGVAIAFVVLVILLSGAGLAWWYTDRTATYRSRQLFEEGVARLTSVIDRELLLYLTSLQGFQGLYAASEQVDRDEFAAFYHGMDFEEQYLGLVAVNYVQIVPDPDRAAFEQAVREDTSVSPAGYPDFTIHPAGRRQEHLVVTYVEPSGARDVLFGLDIATDPVRRQAAERARDTGLVSLTSTARLLGEPFVGDPGFVAYLPIYANGSPRETLEARRLAVRGYIAGVFHVRRLAADVLSETTMDPAMALWIFDGDTLSEATQIYHSARTEAMPDWTTGLRQVARLAIGDRTWTVAYQAALGFGLSRQERFVPVIALWCSIGFSLLVFAILINLATGRSRALRLAGAMTENLRHSEAYFRSLIEHTQDMITVLGSEGEMRYASPSVKPILGYAVDELVHRNAFDFIHADDRQRVFARLAKAVLVPGAVESAVFRFRHKDGTWRILESVGTNQLFDPDIRGMVINSRDMTDREEARRALQDALDRFRTLAANIPHGVVYRCLCDSSWTMLFLSEAMQELTGYPAAEFINNAQRTYASLIHPEDRLLVERRILDAVVRREPYSIEYRIITAEETVKWIDHRGRATQGDDGTVRWLDGIMLDVTEKKHTELQLRVSEGRTRAVIESAHDAIVTANVQEEIVGWNRAAERLFGYAAAEAQGQSLVMLLPERYQARHRSRFAHFASTGALTASQALELEGRRKDGTEVPLEIALAAWRAGEDLFVTAIIRDITKRRQAEGELRSAYEELQATQAQLVQSEKLASIGRLAAGVAHEVKNPLAIVIQGINFLETTPAAAAPQEQEILEIMKKAILRADVIIKDLLELARPSRVELVSGEFGPVVVSTLELVEPQLRGKSIALERHLAEGLPPVRFDANQIRQVLLNLCINGIQAMPTGGTLRVRCAVRAVTAQDLTEARNLPAWVVPGARALACDVEDTGEGIRPDHLAKIFDPFFTTKPPGQGTGLGLSIAASIIEGHHGHLGVRSVPGQGTVFTVLLPVEGEAADG